MDRLDRQHRMTKQPQLYVVKCNGLTLDTKPMNFVQAHELAKKILKVQPRMRCQIMKRS